MSSVVKRILKTAYDVFPIFIRPMAFCAGACIFGVYFIYRHSDIALSVLLLFLIIVAVVCAVTRNRKFIVISVLFLAVCASAVNEFAVIGDLNKLDGEELEAKFVAVEDTSHYEKVNRVLVYCYDTPKIPVNTKLNIHYFFKKDIKCGDCFTARVKLIRLKDNEYKPYNYGNSVYMDCRMYEIADFGEPNKFLKAVGSIRATVKNTISNNFSKDDSAVLTALNTGNKSLLSDIFYDKVLTCGVSHIMVVSGLHISIIIGAVFFLLEKFLYNRYLKAILSLGLIFMLCAVCGFTLSVLRAGIMFLFSAISPVFMRRNDPLNSLGSAVVLLLFISPMCILSVAFWLSVLSTAAVVWIAPYYFGVLIRVLRLRTAIGKVILANFIVSVSAMVFSAPVSLLVFGKISLLAPISFVLLTVPVSIALVFNSLGIAFIEIFGNVAAKYIFLLPTEICAKYIRLIIGYLGTFKIAYVESNIFSYMVFILLIIGLIAGMCLSKFYVKLLKREFVSEVMHRARNNRKRAENNVVAK